MRTTATAPSTTGRGPARTAHQGRESLRDPLSRRRMVDPLQRRALGTGGAPTRGPVQRMVAVAGGLARFNKADFTQLSHLDWAKSISGGPVVGLDGSIAAIGKADILHLVQHGGKGKMVYKNSGENNWNTVTPKNIADLLIAHLPADYTGRVRISSCYSGSDDGSGSSLVSSVKKLLVASNRDDLKSTTVVGWDGPTITNPHLRSDSGVGAETVNDKKVGAAGKLQDDLLNGKYAVLKDKWETDVGTDTRTLEELAAHASETWKEFYQEFTDACKKDGHLLEYVDSLVVV